MVRSGAPSPSPSPSPAPSPLSPPSSLSLFCFPPIAASSSSLVFRHRFPLFLGHYLAPPCVRPSVAPRPGFRPDAAGFPGLLPFCSLHKRANGEDGERVRSGRSLPRHAETDLRRYFETCSLGRPQCKKKGQIFRSVFLMES